MLQFLEYTFSGLATSAVYAVAATGLVLTYTTTGTFNFAHGAIGMVAAFVYWQLRFGWHWPAPLALVVCLALVGPLFGALLDLVIMRRLEGAPETTRLVVTISLLVALLGLALWIWDPNVGRDESQMFQGSVVHLGGVRLSVQEVINMGVAIALAIGLRLFLYATRVGIAMRAAVDDRGLARLTGARPNRGSMLAWAIGVSLAALSGILIAPTLSLSALPLTLLIVNAYAAAMIGRLRSLPYTFAGALILGMLAEYLSDYLRSAKGGQYLQGLYLSIPVIVLFVALLVMPRSRLRGHATARGREIVPLPTRWGALVFAAVVVAGAAMVAPLLSRSDLQVTASIFGLGIVALSLVPLVGFAGQVSLCQLSLAGVGAVVMGHLGGSGNPLALVAAALVAGAVGVVVALPALRLSGIYLALATAAFAVTMDRWIFVLPPFTVFGHRFDLFKGDSLPVALPRLFGVRFGGGRAKFVLLATAFALCALVVVAVRRSNYGSRLLAMKDSPAACATLGLNLTWTKLTVFALSAAMAGVGGALYAGSLQVVDSAHFDFFTGLPILLVVVIGGVGTVGGALAAGIFLGSPLLGNLFHSVTELPLLLAGGAGIGMGRDPNGFVVRMREEWAPVWAQPGLALGVAGLLVAVWLLRMAQAISNWPYAVVSLAILLLTPVVVARLSGRDARRAQARAAAAAGPAVPLEWVGITRPYTADDVVLLERMVPLPEVGARGAP